MDLLFVGKVGIRETTRRWKKSQVIKNVKRNDKNEFIYETGRDSQTFRINLCLLGGRRGEEIRSLGWTRTHYLKWITNKDLLYCTGISAQCYVPAWMGGECGGEWIQVYV